MSLTGINNLSYLTYGAIGLTGVILAVASAYDMGGENPPSAESPSESVFNEPAVPIAPPPPPSEPDASPLSSVFGDSGDKKEEASVLGSVFGESEPKKEPGSPAFGGKKKKRRTKKSKKAKKHRKTKQKQSRQ